MAYSQDLRQRVLFFVHGGRIQPRSATVERL